MLAVVSVATPTSAELLGLNAWLLTPHFTFAPAGVVHVLIVQRLTLEVESPCHDLKGSCIRFPRGDV